MESFLALLEKNVLNTRRWHTRVELQLAIVTWIERTCHRRRRQRSLGRLTPIEFEITMQPLTLPEPESTDELEGLDGGAVIIEEVVPGLVEPEWRSPA